MCTVNLTVKRQLVLSKIWEAYLEYIIEVFIQREDNKVGSGQIH